MDEKALQIFTREDVAWEHYKVNFNIHQAVRDCRLVKSNRDRAVFRTPDGFFMKLFCLKPLQRLFHLDPARKEFELSKVLYARNRTAMPVAIGRSAELSLFVSTEITGSSFDVFLQKTWPCLSRKEKFVVIEGLSELLMDLKGLGILQDDFHLNNILWDEQTETPKIIDLHRAKFLGRPLSEREFSAQLRYILPPFASGLSDISLLRVVSVLSKRFPFMRQKSFRKRIVNSAYGDMRRLYAKKFARRMQGRFCTVSRNGMKIFHNSQVEDVFINGLIERFFWGSSLFSGEMHLEIVKDSRHTLCMKLVMGDATYFIKAFRSSGTLKGLSYLFRSPRAVKNWYSAYNLNYRGIHTPLPVLMIQGRNPWKSIYGLVVYPWIPEIEKRDAMFMDILCDIRKKGLFLKRLASFIWTMHQKGVIHGDCKITNFFIGKSSCYDIGMFDLDSVIFSKRLILHLVKKDVDRMAMSLERFTHDKETGEMFRRYYALN